MKKRVITTKDVYDKRFAEVEEEKVSTKNTFEMQTIETTQCFGNLCNEETSVKVLVTLMSVKQTMNENSWSCVE